MSCRHPTFKKCRVQVPPPRTRCIAYALSHPCLPAEGPTMQAANFIFKSIAISTRRSYSAGECHFIRFCLGHLLVSPGYPLLPARKTTLIHFVTHLSSSVSHGTIRVYLLNKMLRSIKTSLGTPKRTHLSITISILHSIQDKLKPGQSLDPDSSMLWMAFTFHMSRSDIPFQPSIFRPSSLEITIKKSKTDPFWESAKLIIAKSN